MSEYILSQVPFLIKSETSYVEDDFFVSDANVIAKKFIDQWPNWGDSPLSKILFLVGEEGSGKTHLVKIWQKKSNALALSIGDILNHGFNNIEVSCFIFENIHRYGQYSEDILHLVNFCLNNNKFLFITSLTNVDSINIKLQDLTSRLKSATNISLLGPDQEVTSQILMKYFSDRQIKIDHKIIKYLSVRVPRSYPAIKKVIEDIDYISLTNKKPITIPFLQKYLGYS